MNEVLNLHYLKCIKDILVNGHYSGDFGEDGTETLGLNQHRIVLAFIGLIKVTCDVVKDEVLEVFGVEEGHNEVRRTCETPYKALNQRDIIEVEVFSLVDLSVNQSKIINNLGEIETMSYYDFIKTLIKENLYNY